MRVLIINGPLLDKLGEREKAVYGEETLGDINKWLTEKYGGSLELTFYQSAIEGELAQKIADWTGESIVINAGAYTHYSLVIREALAMKNCVKIEIHLSNTFAREEFRNTSVISGVVNGTICGFGKKSYALALESLLMR